MKETRRALDVVSGGIGDAPKRVIARVLVSCEFSDGLRHNLSKLCRAHFHEVTATTYAILPG
jgi:hypothetical protein